MLLLLSGLVALQGGLGRLRELWALFWRQPGFWTLAGSVGFRAFYALVCFSAAYASGWVVAATFQFTVVASLLVLALFGQRFPRRVMLYAVLVFAGVCLVNFSELHGRPSVGISDLLLGAVPALIAAFCYPLGNQLVWQANRPPSAQAPRWAARLPHLNDGLLGIALVMLGLWLFTRRLA
ncbi:multidrug resistance efflux transporter family protein [Deinococcus radiophilus]|uniref:multidrug resistance efflux transporter family protein n=1 Tax=Deinococcus radiophilus TaxID=32062 RepID=UPI001E283B3F|nr:multidrug resistance efflux transporter family protein [Deinococcus radiophilus]UFA49976.1 multidrug resistance efflux transporter family protein [Deinococcus radiophilus]